ncbi:protein unc-93 homolog A isoform 4-T5 [Dama dama]
MLLSSMFLPPVLIGKLGCKWTLVLAMCCYVAFSLGNFYASWYTLIPTSILVGLGAAALWSAQGTYLTIVGNMQARKTGQVGKDVVNQYFGIFFLIFQSSGVWGNLISSLVFGQTPTQGTVPEEQLQTCGASDCLMATASTNSTRRPSQDLIYTLMGIYTGCGFLAVLLTAVFLEPVKDAGPEGDSEKRATPFWSTLLSTFKLLRDKRLRLLILLPMLSGFEQAFLSGDYTRSYATCALGIQFVGYVMICFGAVDALCSVLFGRLARHTGRIALFALGAVTQLACIVALLLWKPHPSQLPVFFVFPGLWGMADAVWQTQNNVHAMVLLCERPAHRTGYRPHRETLLTSRQQGPGLSSGFCLRRTRRPPSPTTASGKPWASSSPSDTARSCASASNCTSSWASWAPPWPPTGPSSTWSPGRRSGRWPQRGQNPPRRGWHRRSCEPTSPAVGGPGAAPEQASVTRRRLGVCG